jgi:hypothetical protein
VVIKEDMLEAIGSMKYVDHDLIDMKKFPELALDKYINVRLT